MGLLPWCIVAQAERYTVPLWVSGGPSAAPQGLLRVVNGTEGSGEVAIYAIDDSGTRTGPATFTLAPFAAAEFDAADLRSGSSAKGLSGGIGPSTGDARLTIETDLDIVLSAYVRAADGTLSAMHDTVRAASSETSGQYRYDVPVFNLSTEMTQVSRLRLINPGDAVAAITIGARDDGGAEAAGGDVTLMLAAGGAKTLTAQQLEAGDTDISGQLGGGAGKWRLTVTSDQPLKVVNIVASTLGSWNNLSTTAMPGAVPVDAEAFGARFAGGAIVYGGKAYRGGAYDSRLRVQPEGQFTETWVYDRAESTYSGRWGYEAIGTNAGLFTLTYTGGLECRGHMYFRSPKAGWLAWQCTGSNNPEGYWLGGNWSVEDGEGDGEAGETSYGVDDALPGVPSGARLFPVSGWATEWDGLSFGGTEDNSATYLFFENSGYIQLQNGVGYTCQVTRCVVRNGTVTQGTLVGGGAASGPDSASRPDLVLDSAAVSHSSPDAGQSFTLSATVRNGGDATSAATTLRYYRSSNATISRDDTQVGTGSVSGLSASSTSPESISLTAPSSAGTYYYGACVDSVTGEADTDNNCSAGVRVSVSSGATGGDSGGESSVGACVEVNNVIELGEGESCAITEALVDKYSLERLSVKAGATASCSDGTVSLAFLGGPSIQLNGLTIKCR